MAAPDLRTFGDQIDLLIDVQQSLDQAVEQRLARGAIREAYKMLCGETSWCYFMAHGRTKLVASYDTGTVTYDLTGGTYEYELTLADGTWPSWARYGHLEITGYDPIYKIAERKSDTVVTMEPNFEPGADITTGTAYELYRSVYTLPTDLQYMHEIHDEDHWWQDNYITPTEWLGLERRIGSTSRPFQWTIMGDPNLYGSMAICVYGRAPSAETIDYIYGRKPARLLITGYNADDYAGTVTASSGSTTVTGSSSAFKSAHVGSVIRFGEDSSTPTGYDGLNPFQEQRIVTAVSSTTSLTVDTALSNSYSGAGYCLSDPIDMPDYMFQAFNRGCEWMFAIRAEPATAEKREKWYRDAAVLAKEKDQIQHTPDSDTEWEGWYHPAWHDEISTT